MSGWAGDNHWASKKLGKSEPAMSPPNHGQYRVSAIQKIQSPEESWDLKTGGLEIPEPCYTESNPSIGGSNDS